jgi:hypothetical protein
VCGCKPEFDDGPLYRTTVSNFEFKRKKDLQIKRFEIQRLGSATRPEVLADQENRTCEPKLEVLSK